MAQFFTIHPDNPQPRLLKQAAEIIQKGGIIAYPTDSCYALACHLDDKAALDRLRKIRGVDDKHHFTLMCRDLAELGHYAKVNNPQFRLLKAATPGAYTFILEASKEVPRRLSHPKRSTIGLRVPAHRLTQDLLAVLAAPMLSTTLILPEQDFPLTDADSIREQLGGRVDLIIEAGACGLTPTTVIDLSGEIPVLLRQGAGDAAKFGL